ncbi:hypothetical protein ACM39_05145 [Chryseobacterium sp. FH2]|uniref:hypothetical protein n=1 Tax=Chryseobacterium sp. FH2 TaxID=1674291 RepID=UPI00065AB5D6|nr:hypothetical protein [Chryseobacterium sp. FH2]KMQ68683.1 hypothetical protein ACM39_05145 [Chryseobacterium sp. FH2]
MKKNLILRLMLIAFAFTLHSCVHDEIISSVDPLSKEYHSKSVFKEDEKYIKNVMQVYQEHETDIKKINGTPLWDYAMTMGHFDESFLIVPVSDGGKIISCLQAPRNGDNITFISDNDREHITFFQKYTTLKNRKPIKSEKLTSQAAKGLAECSFTSVSMWYPQDEYGSNAGYWETSYIVTCPTDQGDGDGDSGNPTYPYPGGGGGGGNNNPEPETPEEDPCQKTKAIVNNPKMQAGLQELKNQSTAGGEKGIKFKADGTPSATITGTAHSVDFGDKTGYAGGYHNHTPSGIPMLSPPDIDQLLGFARAQGNYGNPSNAYLGMVAPNGMHYVIWFNGNYSDALTNFSQDQLNIYTKKYRDRESALSEDLNYVNYLGADLNTNGLEKLFFETLKSMGLEGKVNLQKIENDGIVKNINVNTNNQPISTTCS